MKSTNIPILAGKFVFSSPCTKKLLFARVMPKNEEDNSDHQRELPYRVFQRQFIRMLAETTTDRKDYITLRNTRRKTKIDRRFEGQNGNDDVIFVGFFKALG